MGSLFKQYSVGEGVAGLFSSMYLIEQWSVFLFFPSLQISFVRWATRLYMTMDEQWCTPVLAPGLKTLVPELESWFGYLLLE